MVKSSHAQQLIFGFSKPMGLHLLSKIHMSRKFSQNIPICQSQIEEMMRELILNLLDYFGGAFSFVWHLWFMNRIE